MAAAQCRRVRCEAVVFDMDGLMLDTEPLYKLAWQSASAGLGYNLSDAVYAGFVGRPTPDCEGRLLEEFGSTFPIDPFRRRWPTLWRTAATEQGIQVKAGLLELLGFLQERAIPIAVATSSGGRHAGGVSRGAVLDRSPAHHRSIDGRSVIASQRQRGR